MKYRAALSALVVICLACIILTAALAQAPEPPLPDTAQSPGNPESGQGHLRMPGLVKPSRDAVAPASGVLGWSDLLTEGFEGSFPGVHWTLYGEPNWGPKTYNPRTGSASGYCAGSGAGAVNPPGPYPANMNGWMVHGPFDLTGATAAELRFHHWTKTAGSGDRFWVLASLDLVDWWGYNWTGNWVDQCGGWCQYAMDLKDVGDLGDLTGQSEVYVAFLFESDSGGGDEGSYVDDIVLRALVGGCPGAASST